MKLPKYIDLEQARQLLSELGIKLNQRQMKRAADLDAKGKRKLPFFIDPVDGKRRIEKGVLLKIYNQCQLEAKGSVYSKYFNSLTVNIDQSGENID